MLIRTPCPYTGTGGVRLPIRNTMVRHTLFLSVSSIWMRTIGMLFQIWLSGHIGAAGIGLVQLIGTVGILAATLGTAGVRVGAMYLIADARGRHASTRTVTACCLCYGTALSCLAGVVLFAAAPWISGHWLQAPEAAGPLRILATFLPAGCIGAVLGGWFTACVKIKQLTAVELLLQVLLFGVNIFLLSRASGSVQCCRILLTVNGLGDVALCLILGLLYRRSQRTAQLEKTPGLWRKLLRLCVPLGLSDLLRSSLSTTEHLLIPRGLAAYGLAHGNALAAYGTIHGMVFPVMMFPATLLYAFSDLLVPELARCTAAGSERRVHYLTGRCLHLGAGYACTIAGAAFCLAKPLAELLYPGTQTGHYLQLFAPLLVLLYLDAIVDAMLKGLGQQVASVRYNCITAGLDILLLLALLPRWGIDGYYWAFTVSHSVNFCLSIGRLLRHTGQTPDWVFAGKMLGCAALCALACRTALRHFGCLPAVLLGGGGYLTLLVCLLWLSRALRPGDLRWMRQLLQRQSRL